MVHLTHCCLPYSKHQIHVKLIGLMHTWHHIEGIWWVLGNLCQTSDVKKTPFSYYTDSPVQWGWANGACGKLISEGDITFLYATKFVPSKRSRAFGSPKCLALIWTVQRCTFLSLAIDSFVPSQVSGFGVKASKDILDLIASYLITQALQSDSLWNLISIHRFHLLSRMWCSCILTSRASFAVLLLCHAS